jgi:cobyrinic acid a,c-diamide synthase
MANNKPRVVIGGLRGGSGKTTLALGLIAAWRQRVGEVVSFKKGPDYIDAGWLALAADQPCYNLDPYMMSGEQILDSFWQHSQKTQGAVVEGNRGLFDGMDAEGSCSTAELAKLLQAPVLLVVDGSMVTRTAAASVLGCQHLDPEVAIEGVILNRVAGPRHEEMLRTTIERYCRIPVVGAIPKLRGDDFPERHMGLVTALEHPEAKQAVLDRIQVVERYLDLDKVIDIASRAPALSRQPVRHIEKISKAYRQPVVGVIKDSAFQFYYPENLEALDKRGARLVYVDSLRDKELPHLDALYIGGGFPETHAEQLAANTELRESLRSAIEADLPVYAECGGLMYLGRTLQVGDSTFPMVQALPMDFQLKSKPQGHGYTKLEVVESNPFYSVGTTLKGHEFHYSRVTRFDLGSCSLAFSMRRGTGILDEKDGVCYKNVLATYSHVHAVGTPEWAEGLIRKALTFQRESKNNSVNKIVDKSSMDNRTTNTGVGDGVR